jgi:hypothetical protein
MKKKRSSIPARRRLWQLPDDEGVVSDLEI